MLDDALLSRLETRLREAGALIVDSWAPGLTDEQIDDYLKPLGIDLPEEARIWWRWHNGTAPGAKTTEIAPGRAHIALRHAAELYAAVGDALSELHGIDGLLMPIGNQPAIYFHCAVPRDAPVPIYVQVDHVADMKLVLPSIGELVLALIDRIERGVWETNPDGTWAWDFEKPLPDDIAESGVY